MVRSQAIGKSIFDCLENDDAEKIVQFDNEFLDSKNETQADTYDLVDRQGKSFQLEITRHRISRRQDAVWAVAIEVGT